MQTIWSRAAQAHRWCHRRPCVRAASILTRRSATATRPKRPKVAVSHVFTACYSAIMATAAVADAAAKDQRRKELDTKIEEARAALARMLEESTANHISRRNDGSAVLHNADASPLGLYHALTSICQKPVFLLRSVSRRRTRKAYLERLKADLGFQQDGEGRGWWRTPPARMDEVQEKIVLEEASGNIRYREPANTMQFSKWSEMINNMVDQLLLETYRAPDGTPQTPDLLESAWNNIRMLRSSGYPKYSHTDMDPAAALKARHDLDVVSRNIFRDWSNLKSHLFDASGTGGQILDPVRAATYRRRREYFVGKICHNFLIARYAPNIHNYNTLLCGFGALGETGLAQAVADSLLLHSRMKPTQMTVIALLHHYRLKKDIVGFYNIIRRMTAEDGRGIGIRRKPVKDVKEDKGLFRWAEAADVVVADGFVTERAKLDVPVMEALLDGLIDFEQTRDAATILSACLREGCAMSSRYIHRVAALCVEHIDRVAAVTLLRGFLARLQDITSMIAENISNGPSNLKWSLYQLVLICEGNADRHRVVAPGRIQSVAAENDVGQDSRLERLSTVMWIAHVWARADDIASWAKSLEYLLRNMRQTGQFREARFQHLGHRAWHMTRRQNRTDLQIQRLRSVLTVDWINELCRLYESKAETLELQLLYILISPIPQAYRSYRFLDRSIPLQERLRAIGKRLETMPFVWGVKDCLARADELESKIGMVLYDALPVRQKNQLRRPREVSMRKRGRNDMLDTLVKRLSGRLAILSGQPPSEQEASDPPETSASSVGSGEDAPANRQAGPGAGFFEPAGPLVRSKMAAIPAV